MESPEHYRLNQYSRLLIFAPHITTRGVERLQPPLEFPTTELPDQDEENYLNMSILLQRNHSRQFVLPGGKVEEGEDPLDTIIREIREEHGLLRFDFWNFYYDSTEIGPYPWSSNSEDYGFTFFIGEKAEDYLTPTDGDTTSLQWVNYSDCRYLMQTRQMYPNIWQLIQAGFQSLRMIEIPLPFGNDIDFDPDDPPFINLFEVYEV